MYGGPDKLNKATGYGRPCRGVEGGRRKQIAELGDGGDLTTSFQTSLEYQVGLGGKVNGVDGVMERFSSTVKWHIFLHVE